MRAVVQRVSKSSVTVDGKVTGRTDRGLMVLIGVAKGDGEKDARYIADKISGLRIFEDEEEKMNLSVADIGGSVLAVSQFTLLADARKGRRPSFTGAEAPEEADRLYNLVCDMIRENGLHVETGVFQTHMDVEIHNDGPVTILLDSKKDF
ncbi:MAG: D-tyrosyl-tRNA(Tyr) deacylase [Firmicutes bacterium]|nr:D-tyrosyl-tRNA(Tyr) deacylase [Bacillota bacterium]